MTYRLNLLQKTLFKHSVVDISASNSNYSGPGAMFSLGSAPVLFHLQQDEDLMQYINQHSEDLSQVCKQTYLVQFICTERT